MMLAHSARNGKPPQPYCDHVAGVVKRTCNNIKDLAPFIDKKRLSCYLDVGKDSAEYHDIGKLAARNQDILAGRKKSAHLAFDHRDAGVKYLIGSSRERPSATLVYAHHKPGLPNLTGDSSFRFCDAIADSDAHLQDYVDLHRRETDCVDRPHNAGPTPRLSAMEYRILLSCLVDADYSDTAGESGSFPETRWEERLDKLDEYVRGLQSDAGSASSERNQLRRELYNCCRNAPVTEPLVYCDSPVGTGKTTAVMAYMLQCAIENHLRHIFVILPYTNIISQAVKVFRKSLVLDGEDPKMVIAELHHQADFGNIELRHLASAWTAPIIVTTAVQFFETMATNLPAKLRKLHQLPGSGIIIDESHAALPVNLMPQAWKWITDFSNKWGCRLCFCSGTSFRFWKNPALTKVSSAEVSSLLTDELSQRMENFEKCRVRLEILKQNIPHFMNANELVRYLDKFHGSKMIVFNTVHSAAFFARILRDSGHDVLHLSTALTPEDREKVIEEVKRRLNSKSNDKKSWTLVATSCVECGMDLSFHYGFCELRSLESYLQLSGRVSRNDEFDDGTLICFTITDDEIRAQTDFRIQQEVFTKQIQSGRLPELTITNAVSESFDMQIKSMGGLSEEICKHERLRDFADVSCRFRVISEDTITVAAKPELVEKLHTGKMVTSRELQRGSVHLRKSVLEQLNIEESEYDLSFLTSDQYDSFLGYMKSLV